MYAYNISIKNNNPDYQNFEADCSAYVYFLGRTGQVHQREHMVVQKGNTVTIAVTAPEPSAFEDKNNTKYAQEVKNRIEKLGETKIQYLQTGIDADYLNYNIPKTSSYFILRPGMMSPLFCGDTFQKIPLYKIPYTSKSQEDYGNVNFWSRESEHLFGLWLGTYEDYATVELQDVNSKINKQGIALSKIIEQLTGVPTYYFLFNYRNCTVKEDMNRKCPLTGQDWFIENSSYDSFIAFKCEESRLVSELSANCIDL